MFGIFFRYYKCFKIKKNISLVSESKCNENISVYFCLIKKKIFWFIILSFLCWESHIFDDTFFTIVCSSPVYSALFTQSVNVFGALRGLRCLGTTLRKWDYYASMRLVTLRASYKRTRRVSLPTSWRYLPYKMRRWELSDSRHYSTLCDEKSVFESWYFLR